jgi:multidrug efflux pump subunit AcrB
MPLPPSSRTERHTVAEAHPEPDPRGPIAWFARNGVAANLLMGVIIVAGLFTVGSIRKEVFPEFSADTLTVAMPYLGASPEEVEEGVCIRIEEAIEDVDGIKRIRSVANEGSGVVTIELLPGANASKVLDDIKSRIDAIDTFPEQTERAVIQEVVMRAQVINLAVAGHAEESVLKRLGQQVRESVVTQPGITQAQLVMVRPDEISIEVSELALRRHGLTFDEVAQAVRRSSLDLPGGSIKAEGGEFLLRVKAQAYRSHEFESVSLRVLPDGSRLTVGDVARVVDGFADTSQAARFNGRPAVVIQVFRVGNQNALELADTVRRFAREQQARMPEGVELLAYQDYSEYLRSRMDLLIRNAAIGFVLVFVVLALFLRFRLAFWTSLGIPVSFLGTLWLMPTLDVSINMLSLFAFLIVLGIVVDDAIVVSENIHAHLEQGKTGIQAAIDGTREVAVPVVFSVLTTVAAFAPMAMVEGNTGKVLKSIPLIVIPTLLFSLVESLWILPNHLSHLRRKPGGAIANARINPFKKLQESFSGILDRFITSVYRPLLEWSMAWRYLVLSLGVASLLLIVGLVGGGWLKFQFFPPVEGDDIAVFVTLPEGTPGSITRTTVDRIANAALDLRSELESVHGPGLFRQVLASVGDQPFRTAVSRNGGRAGEDFARPNVGEVHIQLSPSEARTLSATEVVNRWRAKAGLIPDAVEVVFSSSLFSSGNAVDVRLTGPDVEALREAAEELKTRLGRFPAIKDTADSYRAGKQEFRLRLKPEAEAAGLTLMDLARQVRQAFYGEEVQRVQRGRDDVRVMVRYPENDRRSLASLEELRIRLPDGTEVPFPIVASAAYGRGYASITRVDRQRSINVTADVDRSIGNANEILAEIRRVDVPELMERHPGLSFDFEGEQREQKETMGGLLRGFGLALFLIFALIAIPLKSYLHPFVVMSSIPFGFVGAVLGHVVMGLHLTVLSMFGLVALAGVAVNDSLVLVDFINRARRSGIRLIDAVREAGVKRLRPIVLTSLTTFAGLTPLILEKSVQAQFLIPMAVSLGFGVVYCTVTTLLLVPAIYLVIEDVRRLAGLGPASPEE